MRGASLLAVCALVVGATPAGASPLAVKQEPWHQRAFTGGQLEGCSSYQGMDSCRGQQTDYPEATVAGRRWQTPPPGHVLNAGGSEWQHYHALQGYARVDYASDRQSAVVHVVTFVKEAPSSSSPRLRYRFGGESATWTESAEFTVSAADYEQRVHAVGEHVAAMEGLAVDVWAPDVYNATLRLDPLFFVWQTPRVALSADHEKATLGGQKGAVVELFGWPYADIEQECTFLASAGYLGVKIAPPQESVMSENYVERGELNPWYFGYQPVSYRLRSRLGTRDELRKMILTCRKQGVRVYADAVVNHMTGGGNDVGMHRTSRGSSCVYWGGKNGTGLAPFFTHSFGYEKNVFTGERPALEYPAVPYGPEDFHCERTLGDWSSGFSLNYGWLVGLTDLNTERPYVRQRIADYFTDLLGFGFAGFRVDAAKHIRPDDLAAIFGLFVKNMGGHLPDDFFTWLEVIIGGEKMLLACEDNDYSYYGYFDRALAKAGLDAADREKVKIWSSDYPKEMPVCGHWILPASRFVIQNDDHDQQNEGSSSRDMADKGSVLIKDRDVERHRQFEKTLFERRDADWRIKLVLSGYTFMKTGAQGFPDGKSDCSLYRGNPFNDDRCTKSVPYAKAFDANACGYTVFNQKTGDWAEGVYTRVHRDRGIVTAMREWMGLAVQEGNTFGLPAHC